MGSSSATRCCAKMDAVTGSTPGRASANQPPSRSHCVCPGASAARALRPTASTGPFPTSPECATARFFAQIGGGGRSLPLASYPGKQKAIGTIAIRSRVIECVPVHPHPITQTVTRRIIKRNARLMHPHSRSLPRNQQPRRWPEPDNGSRGCAPFSSPQSVRRK